MTKKLLILLVALLMVSSLALGCTPKAEEAEDQPTMEKETEAPAEEETEAPAEEEATPVTLEIVASQPEYASQEQEIWNIYLEENPHVTIDLISVNEDTAAAYNTRVASGDAPDIILNAGVVKNDYNTYQNLADIGYPYWDLITFDAVNIFSVENGTEEGYVPCLNPFSGITFSFIFHEDEMTKAGLDPRANVRSMADFDAFLAELKPYVDSSDTLKYTLDMGWHSWCVFNQQIDELAVAMGSNQTELTDLWLNRTIAWNDVENNPYVPAFEKLKEWYDMGYLPARWWTRNWESDFEAGFTAKSSILAFHGPWLWTKVETADPEAQLSGFPYPPNEDGIIQNGPVSGGRGAALYTSNIDGENQEEAVKAFIWWNSPEIIKIRSEAFSTVPLMDLSEVGFPELTGSQYVSVIKPIQEGFFGDNVLFDSAPWAKGLAYKYIVKDAANVLASDDMAGTYGDYFEGTITIQELCDILQQRYDVAYSFE